MEDFPTQLVGTVGIDLGNPCHCLACEPKVRLLGLLSDLDDLREAEFTERRLDRLNFGLARRLTGRNVKANLQRQARCRDERGEHLRIEIHPLLRWYRTLPAETLDDLLLHPLFVFIPDTTVIAP